MRGVRDQQADVVSVSGRVTDEIRQGRQRAARCFNTGFCCSAVLSALFFLQILLNLFNGKVVQYLIERKLFQHFIR